MAKSSKIRRNRGRWSRPDRAHRYRERHGDKRHRGSESRARGNASGNPRELMILQRIAGAGNHVEPKRK